MDYRLIKENFDKATAELEEAQQGAPAFAVGDKVKFLSAYTMMGSDSPKALARGEVTGIEPAGHERKGSDQKPTRIEAPSSRIKRNSRRSIA